MVVSELVRLSEDKVIRHAYQKRQDEIMLYNKKINDYIQRAEESDRRAEESDRRSEKAEAEIEELRKRLAELETK